MNIFSCFQKLKMVNKMTSLLPVEANLRQQLKEIPKPLRKGLEGILKMLREENIFQLKSLKLKIIKIEQLLNKGYLPSKTIKRIQAILAHCKQTLPYLHDHENEQVHHSDIHPHLLQIQLYLNPKQLCSSKKLIYHSKVSLSQACYSYLKTQLQEIYAENQVIDDKVDQILCAGFNDNTIYILIGINEQDLIEGQILYEEQKEKLQKAFEERRKQVYPKTYSESIRVHFIPVLKSYQTSMEQHEEGRYFILIQLITSRTEKLYFKKTSKAPYYESYVKNYQNKICKINGQQLYKFLHFKHNNSSKEKKQHFYCEIPQIGNQIFLEKAEKDEKNPFLILKKSYQSVFIVPSKSRDKYLVGFFQQLKKQSNDYQFLKPYLDIQGSWKKSLWILSHNTRFKIVEDIKRKYDHQKAISMEAVEENIRYQIENEKEIHEKLQQFEKVFAKEYPKEILSVQKRYFQKEDKTANVIKFSEWPMALFAYMYFQTFEIKLTFLPSIKLSKSKKIA